MPQAECLICLCKVPCGARIVCIKLDAFVKELSSRCQDPLPDWSSVLNLNFDLNLKHVQPLL